MRMTASGTDCALCRLQHRHRHFARKIGTPLPPDFSTRLPPEERLPEAEATPAARPTKSCPSPPANAGGASRHFVFRYPQAACVALDAPDRAEIEAQWEKLKSFAERVFVTAEGHFKGAYQTFSSSDDFETKVEGALRQWLEENVLKGRASLWPIAIKGSPFRGLEPFGASTPRCSLVATATEPVPWIV